MESHCDLKVRMLLDVGSKGNGGIKRGVGVRLGGEYTGDKLPGGDRSRSSRDALRGERPHLTLQQGIWELTGRG